jgi:hypothetical protein
MSFVMVMYSGRGGGDSENEGRFVLMVIPNGIYREVKVKTNGRNLGKNEKKC